MRWCLQGMHAKVALLTQILLQQQRAAGRGNDEAHADGNDRVMQEEGRHLTTGLKRQAFSISPHATACMPGHDELCLIELPMALLRSQS